MNPILRNIIIEGVKRRHKSQEQGKKASEKFFQKKAENLEVEIKHEISDFIYLIIGVLAATFGLKGFLLPNSFIDGGVTGISLIVRELSGISLPVLIFCINLPFLILGYFAISKRFAIKSVIGILLLSLSLFLIPVPTITEDGILIAMFGGLFLGLGIGMAIRGGAIIDGTEVLAIYISRKTSMTVGNVILIFNVIIFFTAAYFLSTEIALYAILNVFCRIKNG